MADKAAIYARFSSDNQRDESIDAQVRACEEYAERNGLQIVTVYTDRAKTATSDRRPGFQRMIEDSGKGYFQTIIVHKLDRFARDRFDSAHYRQKLKRNRVRLVSVLEPLDGSPESVILESVLEGMSQYYSMNLAREVRKGMGETARQCKHTGGIPPLGYDVDPATKKYVVNPAEAETVRKIFDMYLSGVGYSQMLATLNDEGRKTKLGGPFGKNSIHDLLTNEKYGGIYVFNRSAVKDCDGKRNNRAAKPEDEIIRIPGGVPAIVTEEVFQKAQEKMKNNKRQPGAYKARETYLLSGLIICGECLERDGTQHAMMGNIKFSGRAKVKHVTYRCGNRERTKNCDNKEIRREFIEDFVMNELEKRLFNDRAIALLARKLNEYQVRLNEGKTSELVALEKQQNEIRGQMTNIVNAVAAGFSQTAFAEKLKELEDALAQTENKIIELRSRATVPTITEETVRQILSAFREYVRQRNIPEIKKFISSYVEKVIVYKDRIEAVFVVREEKLVGNTPYTFRLMADRKTLPRRRRRAA